MGAMYRETDVSERPLLVIALVNRLIALDRRSGEVRWEHRLSSIGGGVEIAFLEGRVFAVTSSNQLHCVDYLSGEQVKSMKLRGDYAGRPSMVVDGGQLFIATGGEILCLDRDCSEVWFNGLKGRGVAAVSLGFPGNVRHCDASR